MSKSRLSLVMLAVAVVGGTALWTGPTLSSQTASGSGTIRGTVKSADGTAMEGVTISARASDKTFTTTVFSDRQGNFTFPALDAGQYKVWAQAVGFDAARADFTLSATGMSRNLTLTPHKEVSKTIKQMSGTEYFNSIPDRSPEDRRLKHLVANNCTGCHTAGYVLQNRWDANGWGMLVDLMTVYPSGGGYVSPEQILDTTRGNQVTRAYRDELAQYLGRVRGATELSNLKLLPRPTGEATQVVITEFDLPRLDDHPVAKLQDGSDWSLGTPTRYVGRAAHDVWLDSQGNVWVADDENAGRTTAKLDPRTGKITNYNATDAKGRTISTHSVVVDNKDKVWLTNGNEGTFIQFDPATEKFTKFEKGEGLPNVGGTLDVDSQGNPWAPHGNGAIKLDVASGKYVNYPAPLKNLGTYGIAVDKNDNAWYTSPGTERIIRVDARTGDSREVVLEPNKTMPNLLPVDHEREQKLRTAELRTGANSQTPQHKTPRRISADPNGNYVWVSLFTGNALARIDINTFEVKEYALPTEFSQPYANATDKNGNVWINAISLDRIVKFDPKTEKFTEYKLPSLGTEIRHVQVDNRTNPPTVWAPYNRSNKIVRLEFKPVSQ